jgi:glucosamine--fructose-6-phosphate aminotransferase (isomerizing)
MCGIVGYIGPRQAAGLLLEGLRRMEYRGYDSAGIAVVNGHGLEIAKAAGKLSMLEQELEAGMPSGTLGIGHTRWATHGAPTTPNAHPHTDQSGRIAVIHNGIIENSSAIRKTLERRGHTFKSETDTEVLAHLVGEYYAGNLEEAVAAALREVDGAYGLAFISADEPGILVAARKGSPLLVGVGENEWFVASDASPLLQYTRSVVYLDDGEMVVLSLRAAREPLQHAPGPPAGRGRDGAGQRPEPERRPAQAGRAHHHHRLRHLVALRPHRGVHAGGDGPDPGRGGVRLRVPLPEPRGGPPHAGDRHLPVG